MWVFKNSGLSCCCGTVVFLAVAWFICMYIYIYIYMYVCMYVDHTVAELLFFLLLRGLSREGVPLKAYALFLKNK